MVFVWRGCLLRLSPRPPFLLHTQKQRTKEINKKAKNNDLSMGGSREMFCFVLSASAPPPSLCACTCLRMSLLGYLCQEEAGAMCVSLSFCFLPPLLNPTNPLAVLCSPLHEPRRASQSSLSIATGQGKGGCHGETPRGVRARHQ